MAKTTQADMINELSKRYWQAVEGVRAAKSKDCQGLVIHWLTRQCDSAFLLGVLTDDQFWGVASAQVDYELRQAVNLANKQCKAERIEEAA